MPELWQCTLYDTLTDYPYADWRVYRTREEAERRAKRMTYEDDYVEHGASVHKVTGCWKEPDSDGVPVHVGDVMDENAKLRELVADAWGYIIHPANATWTHEKRKEVRQSLSDRMRELGVEL